MQSKNHNGNGNNHNGNGPLPIWVWSGLLFMGIIMFISFFVGGVSRLFMLKPLSYFICMVFPSMIINKFFMNCCPLIATNRIIHVVFFVAFWFVFGAVIGLVFEKIKNYTYGGSNE